MPERMERCAMRHAEGISTLAEALPSSLAERLERQYGGRQAALIAKGYAARRRTTLRANTLKADRGCIVSQLDAAGIAWDPAPAPALADAIVIREEREPAIRALPAYDEGALYLQSLSAMLPGVALAPAPDENILDMAAAPGGKTCHMAALSEGKALICACEKNHVRAEKLRYNLAKQGASRVNVMECDARKLDDFFSFDKVLLDAPCSGSGTVRIIDGSCKTGFSDELLKRSVKAQQALLRKALSVLKPGGTMVYATCSILEDENERVLEQVLPKAKAQIVALPDGLLDGVPQLPCRLPEAAVVRPTELFEGFFLALIEKTH